MLNSREATQYYKLLSIRIFCTPKQGALKCRSISDNSVHIKLEHNNYYFVFIFYKFIISLKLKSESNNKTRSISHTAQF